MKLVIDLTKSVKDGNLSKPAKGASKPTKGKTSTSPKGKTAASATSKSAKGTHSAAIEKKYPGGEWKTMRGHHVYIKADGKPATETLPASMKSAEAKSGAKPLKAKPTAAKEVPKKKRVKQTAAMKLGQKEAADDKIRVKNLEERNKQHKKENREMRKKDKERALSAPTLVREQAHDGSKPAKEVKQSIPKAPDAKTVKDSAGNEVTIHSDKAARAAKQHLETAGDSLNRELEKKGKAAVPMTALNTRLIGDFGNADPHKAAFPVKSTIHSGYEWKENPTLDEIARSHQGLLMNAVTKKMAHRYGLQALQREHAWFDKNGKPADLFGDVHQEANLGFIQGVQEYLRDPKALHDRGVNPLTHAVSRAMDNVKRRMQRILNDVPLPQKFTTPLAVYSAARNKVLSDEKKSHLRGSELRDAIHKQLEADGNLGIIQNLSFEDARNASVTDIGKKLDLLEGVKRLQRANTRLDRTTDTGDGDKEQELHEKVGTSEDKDARVVAQERDKELHGALHKFLGDMLSDREAQIVAMKHGVSLKQYLGSDDDEEFKDIAEKLGLGISNAKKLYYGAMKKLKNAPAEKLADLRKMMLDKAMSMDLMKSLYVMDLEDFMIGVGLAKEDLQPVFVGLAWGESTAEIEKSLPVTQFIGSYITTQAGIRANIIEYALPDDNTLIKAFNDLLIKSQGDPHDEMRAWVKANPDKHAAMAKAQGEHLAKKSGGLTWSEQLQADNPGSAWVTWHGHRVLMKGNGNVVYSSHSQEHRDKYHPTESNPVYAHESTADHEDQGVKAQRDDWEGLKSKWHGSEEYGKGEKHKLSADANNWGHYLKTNGGVHFQKDVHGNMSDEELTKIFGAENVKSAKLNAMKKMAPGHYELTNPETGKRVVVHLDWKEANRDANGNPTDGKSAYALELKRAYDPSADVTKRDNKELQSNRGFLRYLGYNLEPEKGDKEGLAKGDYHFSLNDVKDALGATLRNQANTDYDKNKKGTRLQLRQISADEFEGQHGQATTTLRENMAYKLHNIKDVTPGAFKTTKGESVPYRGKVFEVDTGNGTTHRFEISAHGTFSDPVMQRLIDPAFPIHTANDLYTALSSAIGNERYMTLSNNEWAVGKGIHHHVKIKFDGQGAPIVVGGAFDGMRLQDAAEMTSAEDKAKSLFKNGKLVGGKLQRTKDAEIPLEEGNSIRYREGNTWKTGKILKVHQDGFIRIRKENGDTDTYHRNSKNRIRPAKTGKQVAAGAMPTVHMNPSGELSIVAPDNEEVRGKFTELGIDLDPNGRADVSINQLEKIRDKVGGFSMDDAARNHLEDYFRKQSQDAPPKDVDELWQKFNPANIDGWRSDSYLHPGTGDHKNANFSSAQVEGMEHLINAERGIAGHGITSTLAMTFVA